MHRVVDGINVRTLRERLKLDSGYLSRLLRSLKLRDSSRLMLSQCWLGQARGPDP